MHKMNSMPYKGKRILIFEGRARQCLPLIRSFKKQGCSVSALCDSKWDIAYASRYVDRKIIGCCNNEDEEGTTQEVLNLVNSGDFDLIIPTTDFAAKILSKNKNKIEQRCKVASNEFNVFVLAENKNDTMKVCMDNNIPCPITLFEKHTKSEILKSGITFPLVIKPAISYGAIGFKIVHDEKELDCVLNSIEDISQYVIQEYIPQSGLQYECAMFIDSNNDVKTSVVFSKNRWFPIDGGSSTLNITVKRPDIAESCSKLLKLLNWRGAADIDLIQDPRDGIAKIMEINPRVSGSVKITFDAKTDQALQMLQLAFGDDVTKYDAYLIGRRLRCSQTDLLWFIKSKNRFKAKPSWFSCFKTHDQIFYWSDPLPYFAFSIKSIKNYKKEMNKRK